MSYFIEEHSGRFYALYIEHGTQTQTVFDVCKTHEAAEAAIEQHKAGTHPTQWKPT